MNQDNLKNKLKDIICQIADVDQECIALETDLSQLGINSIGLLTAICLIEDEFGIILQNENLFQIKSFGELMNFVSDKGNHNI